MTSAKLTIGQQDRSTIVPMLTGMTAGLVVNTEKGDDRMVSSVTQYLDIFGLPDPRLGPTAYAALTYLKNGNRLYLARATSQDAKLAAVLVRSKIKEVPLERGAVLHHESLIVDPLPNGLTPAEFDTYQFPQYLTNKLYAQPSVDITVSQDQLSSNLIDSFIVSNQGTMKVGDNVSIAPDMIGGISTLTQLNDVDDDFGETFPTTSISSIEDVVSTYEMLELGDFVSVEAGMEVMYMDDVTPTSFVPSVYVVRSATMTSQILVSDSDLIQDGSTIVIDGTSVVVESKKLYAETDTVVTLDTPVPYNYVEDPQLFVVTQSQFEERDAFLVASSNTGRWGNRLSIGITPSRNNSDLGAFNIVVYLEGVLVETWEVARNHIVDGFNRQLDMMSRINGSSKYIKVLNNPSNMTTDEDGNEHWPLPLFTDYSLWQRNPEDVFISSGATTTETILKGHSEIKVSSVTNLIMGSRIKFVLGQGQLSKEYKVLSSSVDHVIIDRPIEEDIITMTWTDDNLVVHDTLVMVFDDTYNDPATGVVAGIRSYPIDKLSRVYYNYRLNANFIISGVTGVLLSAGANMTTGGSNGSTLTIADYMRAATRLENRERTPVAQLDDGGIADPSYAIHLDAIARKQNYCHAYQSVPLSAEESADPVAAVVAYRNSTGLNSEYSSLFAGWTEILDEYNNIKVWTPPSSYAIAAQSYVTRNYSIWEPAAGYVKGQVAGLRVVNVYEEGERDVLVENQINPIRSSDSDGLAIWGNETTVTKPSPLQLRSVAMLLIVIKNGLDRALQPNLFFNNTEKLISNTEGAINAFMRDDIGDGVYDYVFAIQDIITDTDIDNRLLPVYLGIQPTMDIKMINANIAIYNRGAEISIG